MPEVRPFRSPRVAAPIAEAAVPFNAVDNTDAGRARAKNLPFPAPFSRTWTRGRGAQIRGGDMASEIVKKRSFLCVGGYEPIDPAWWHQRFVRELDRFEKTWNTKAIVSAPTVSDEVGLAEWKIDTQGQNWRTETDFVLLRWDDFVTADFARSDVERVPRGIIALGDFVFSGAAYHYLRTSIRYFFFFLYPIILLAGLIAAAIAVPYLLSLLGLPIPAALAPVIAVAAFVAFLYWPGRFLLIHYMLDDWIFAG